MIIFGWLRSSVLLGQKIDECPKCGVIGPHGLMRKSWWFDVFWVPVLLLWFKHGLVCANCGHWTGVRWLAMRRALRTGSLALVRPRPNFDQLPPDDWGRRPSANVVLDPVVANPKRGLWDVYIKVWPVLVAIVVVAVIVFTPHTKGGAVVDSRLQDKYGEAHDCWIATDDSIAGCRLDSGVIDGTTSSRPTTCYFNEPVPATMTELSCDR